MDVAVFYNIVWELVFRALNNNNAVLTALISVTNSEIPRRTCSIRNVENKAINCTHLLD